MPNVAPAALAVAHSGIREIVNLVASRPGHDIIRLEIGEPGFATPDHIVRAGADGSATARYGPSAGHLRLRDAITDRLQRVHGITTTPDRVIVTQGAVQACFATLLSLVGPGDEVIVPDPAWPNYEMQAVALGATPVRYPLRAGNGFVPDPDEIAALITPRTRAIVLNSPGNPTGAVIGQDVVAAMVGLARSADITLLADEVYDELIFDGEPANVLLHDDTHVVGVYSFSKTYAMTGWRVGYAVAPNWLAPTLAKLQEPQLSCIPDMVSDGALAALAGPQDAVAAMRSAYRSRRDVAVDLVAAAGIDVVAPRGAFYLMLPLAPGADSRLAAFELVDEGVSTAPGTSFGDVAADHLRLSLASEEPDLREGIGRILGWYGRTDGGAHLVGAARAVTR